MSINKIITFFLFYIFTFYLIGLISYKYFIEIPNQEEKIINFHKK
jgi:hypothetical protein